MELISKGITVSLPNYLSSLPIPNSIGGIFHLSVKEWAQLVPLFGTVSFLSWVTYTRFFPRKKACCNPNIQKGSAKVVHSFDIEDLNEKNCYCRCWRSKKFPYCDGSHNSYNEESGDNVGPILIKRKTPPK